MDEPTQLLIKRNNLSTNVEWLRYTGAAPGGLGAPLATEDGIVVGFKTSLNTEKFAFGISSHHLMNLKNSIKSNEEGVPIADFTGGQVSSNDIGSTESGSDTGDTAAVDGAPVFPNGFRGLNDQPDSGPPSLPASHPNLSLIHI